MKLLPRIRWDAHAYAVVFVMLLGAALRLYDLGGVPTQLIPDELDPYLSVQSLITTGHDIDGTRLPFLYSPFTRHPPIYGISEYASSLVFGNNAFGLRFPAAAFGLAAIALMYAIALQLTGRRDIALATALAQATQPIFVHFSRVAWEPASELPFLLGGLYVLLRTFGDAGATKREGRRLAFKGLALAAVLLGLTSYTYMAGWGYAVVLGGAVLALNAWRLRSWEALGKGLGAIAIWALVSAPALWMWSADERPKRLSIFNDGFAAAAQSFASTYLKQFHWSYLVTTGDSQPGLTWRYLVGFGAFYWWLIPLAAIGLVAATRYLRTRWALLWVWLWLLVYPLGSALTNEGAPNAPRTLAGAPVFCLLAAIGFAASLDAINTMWPSRARVAALAFNALFAVLLTVSIAQFSVFYFTQYVRVYPNAWDSGTSALFAAIRERHSAYARACFSVLPAWYDIDTYVRYYIADLPIRKIENITDPACFLPGTMLVTDNAHRVQRSGFIPIATIRDVDGAPFAVISGRPTT